MILVELESGLRKQFTSTSELSEAIARGEVGRGARIYHHLRQHWLPITRHPEFRRRWSSYDQPLPPLQRTRWTFFSVEPDEGDLPATAELQRRAGDEAAESEKAAEAAGPPAPAWRRAVGRALRRFRSRSTP